MCGASACERADIARVVVHRAILPAAPDDADPLKRERADGRVVGFAATALAVVVVARPVAVSNGAARKLMQRLHLKFVGGPPSPDQVRVATADGDGRDADQGGDIRRTGEAVAILAKRDQQSRRERWTGP